MLQMPNPTQRETLESLADYIERSTTFDMSDRARCVIGHARQMGLVRKKNGHARTHDAGCACGDCCNWDKASEKLGISVNQMHDIFAMRTSISGPKSAAKYLRKLIPA